MKKLFFLLCLLMGSMSLMATNDTIDLTLPAYSIDAAQVNYYTSGGKNYFKFIMWNDADDYPELRFEAPATSKTHIQGSHEVIIESNLSRFTGSDLTEIALTRGQFWAKYTGSKNVDGDPIYQVLAFGKGTNDLYYLFRGQLPFSAVDETNPDGEGYPTPYALEDEEDAAVTEPEISNGSATGIDEISTVNSQISTQKLLLDGQLYILRGDHTYDTQGKRIK